MDRGRLTLLGVPIDSVGREGGTELGPSVLRERLSGAALRDAGDTGNRIRGLDRDPGNGWLAYPDILNMSAEVRGRVAEITATGQVPLILGGCCTLLPAALAGARDSLGEIGLAYFDGHLDLFTGQTSPTGEGADMPAATILGMAPADLLDVLGGTPIVAPEHIAFVGARDREELDLIAPLPAGLGLGRIEYRDALRHADLAHTGQSIADELTSGAGRFWLHLDVDVLDRHAFPATDYLMPDGLSMPELRALLAPIAGSPGIIGINVTCFNPEKDRDESCGRALADLLETTLIT
ncbi:MAG TPA: arginase family protein [Solirubrobacterales bacterium]|nr:arginase family protein [Solirubrobacterales bacterium]